MELAQFSPEDGLSEKWLGVEEGGGGKEGGKSFMNAFGFFVCLDGFSLYYLIEILFLGLFLLFFLIHILTCFL